MSCPMASVSVTLSPPSHTQNPGYPYSICTLSTYSPLPFPYCFPDQTGFPYRAPDYRIGAPRIGTIQHFPLP